MPSKRAKAKSQTPKTMRQIFVFAAILTSVTLACSHPPAGAGSGEVETSPMSAVSFRVEKVIGGLEVPWSIVWDPAGRMLFTERPGRVRVFENGALREKP